MDIKTLSQQLNMPINELQARIREAGFNVSPRARKINNNLAREIVRKLSGKPRVPEEQAIAGPTSIAIPAFITVKELSQKLNQPVTVVIKKLMENGVMATINEEIDAETASIIAAEFGAEVETHREETVRLGLGYVYELLAKEDPAKLVPRPPIVAVMGHVDHGKTTLLDTIRKTNVAGKEAGAITQHIGAYQVEVPVKQEPKSRASEAGHGIPASAGDDSATRRITFLDTPGHEAFAAMRARGANVTDIIVLVVAADDSVKPQTAEVINRAKLTRTPMVVAINKMDKPDANPEKVKADLAALGITVEDWGGQVPAVPISAKTGQGLDKLLEIILLAAEVEEIKANPEGVVLGAVIESHMSAKLGPLATVLVQNGTLKVGDPIVVGRTAGRLRTMQDALGGKLKAASPGTPVVISGISAVPGAGDILKVAESLEEAKLIAAALARQERAKRMRKPLLKTDPNKKELKLIIRSDVAGSLEAIQDVLSRLESDEVKLTVVSAQAGEITEGDISLAESTGSVIVGFHAPLSARAAKLAKTKNVTIDQYEVIYELVEDVTAVLLSMMSVEVEELPLGRAKIKAIFRTEKNEMIIGGEVLTGKIADKKKFRISRDKQMAGEGKIEELQQNKVEVDEVRAGSEFGVRVKTSSPIKAGDILEIYDETVKKKELKK